MVDDTLRYSDVGKVDYCGLVSLIYNFITPRIIVNFVSYLFFSKSI